MLVPAGPFVLGVDGDATSRGRSTTSARRTSSTCRRSGSARVPVTNAEWQAFIDAGGYDEPRWWSDARLGSTGSRPAWSGRCSGRADGSRRRFGVVEEIPADEPVQHVCFFEAEAYAAWAGARLPTEQEWEKACAWDPGLGRRRRWPWGDSDWTPALANLGGDALRPAPVGAYPAGASAYGVEQMIGDVWEWTSSGFEPWPGFAPMLYADYSAPFFGGDYRVLRGGSWAVGGAAIRPSFRNWDLPDPAADLLRPAAGLGRLCVGTWPGWARRARVAALVLEPEHGLLAAVLRAAPADAAACSTPTAGASGFYARRAARAGALALGPAAVGRRVVRLGRAGAARRARAGGRPLGHRRACRWTRPPPRRSPTAAGCSRTTAGSTATVLPAAPRRRVGLRLRACSPPTCSPPGPSAWRETVREVAAPRPGGVAQPAAHRRRAGSSASPGATRSATSSSDDGVVVASEPWDDDPRWVDVPDRPPDRGDPGRGHRDRSGELMPMRIRPRRPPRPRRPGRAAGRRRPRGPDRHARRRCRRSTSTTRAAASCSTRSPGCRSTTRPAPSGRSSTRAPPRSPRSPVPRPWSSSAAARRRRPGCCCGRCAGPARCARFVPFDVDPAVLRGRQRRGRRGVPGPRGRAGRRRLRAAPRRAARGVRAGCWPSSARRSATSSPAQRARLPRRVPRHARPRRRASCSAPTWSRTPDRLVAAYDDAPGVTAEFNKNVLARAQPRAGRRLRPRRVRARRASGTPSTSGSRCGCGPRATSGCTSPASTSTSQLRARRGDAHRDLREVPPDADPRELAAAGLRLTHWWTDPAGDFALSLSSPA